MTQSVIPKYLGLKPAFGVELGRFVLAEHLPGNSEGWALGKVFRLLRRELAVSGVVSFCDPVPRFDAGGREVKRSHTGVIYKAHNARYKGTTLPRTLGLHKNS